MTRPERGYTLIELLLALAISTTMIGVSIPATQSAVQEIRAAAAARHLAARLSMARIEAVRRAAAVGFRFEAEGSDYRFTLHVDGNGNGIRTAETASLIDAAVGSAERLRDTHAGVVFGLQAGVPDLDGARGSDEGVRIGSSRILTLSPDGTATSGTLYVHGVRAQYAVRVLGATGRVRLFYYDAASGRWIAR